jgi:glycosyltransferase involved in cell wall biosynthesis
MGALNPTGAVTAPRTLFLLNSLCIGGAEKQVVALFNGLAAAGHAPLLQCIKDEDTLLGQIEPALRANVQPGLGVSSGLVPRAVRRLARQLDALAIDVVVCTNMYALLYGSLARTLARRRADIRLVEVFHTTDVGSRKEQWSMILYRRLVRSADLLVYVCHGQASHWRDRGLRARQDVVIYNGIDTQRFADRLSALEKSAQRQRLGLRDDDFVVGLCAVMRPEKAHGDLLEALVLLRDRGIGVRALLIGDGPLRPRLEARIDALGLRGHVRITGLLDDVRPAIASCDAMVLASHAVETFSIAALEAMALGKPMIMTRIGGAMEQVIDGVDGRLYPPGDVCALAAAIAGLRDRELCREMGQCAALRVRAAFGLERMVRNYADTLQALAERRPARSDPLVTSPG